MYPYWEDIIEPVLRFIHPGCLVEIGCEAGKTTKRLLSYCERNQAVLHGIDPSPRFDVDEWKQQFANRFIFHRKTSLQALPLIDNYDVVFIDGDHNWYTVFHELKLIEEKATSISHTLPVILLHDVGWPYGRRDLYYNPQTIPEEFRHPFAKKGIHPDSCELVQQGGFNSGLFNAVHENGPKNGVLTAVEDFQSQCRQPLELIVIPGFHGLGILCPSELKQGNPDLEWFLNSWTLTDAQQRYLTLLEKARIRPAIKPSQ